MIGVFIVVGAIVFFIICIVLCRDSDEETLGQEAVKTSLALERLANERDFAHGVIRYMQDNEDRLVDKLMERGRQEMDQIIREYYREGRW